MDSVPTPYNDFRCTHRFCSGVLLTTVYAGNYKVIDSKKVPFLTQVVLPGPDLKMHIQHSWLPLSLNVGPKTAYYDDIAL